MTTTTVPQQLNLPGQAHLAPGPLDLNGMYLMHFALRRDLNRFVAAVRSTPVGEDDTWTALLARWDRFAEVLHHHHTAEDRRIWPRARLGAQAAGRHEDVALLDRMEAEHEVIDPALAGCRAAFAAMAEHPCTDHRNALDVRMTEVRETLGQHLAGEETEALPLLQRTISVEEWAASEKEIERDYGLRIVPFALPWVKHRLPREAAALLDAQLGVVEKVLGVLFTGRFERAERRTFRYA